VLVVEDDPDGLRSVVEALSDAGFSVTGAASATRGRQAFEEHAFDLVLSDLKLPDGDGLALLEELRRLRPTVPILLMTAYGSVETAVTALKKGAYDYLVKPLDLDDLLAKVRRAAEASRLRAEVDSLQSEVRRRYSARAMVATSPAMKEVLRQIAAVAGTNATVLVLGESGTGKELVARALHADSRRAAGPFVAVNCGAFTETLLESELFGHERGAFTGATSRHTGAIERAHNGTLFLDEIGIAPRSVQARLLRVLEEREIIRVGGGEPIKVNVRVVAASNRELQDLVEEGQFRHDLLYRLQVVTIRLPPLRQRTGDIRPLAERFLAAASVEHGRHLESVEPGFFAALESHTWPGNVRELRNVVESAVIMARGATLSAGDLSLSGAAGGAPGAFRMPDGLTLADLEREALLQTLRRFEGNRTLTADALGISTRTIQRKIQEYNLPF
jgi:DNA-binding NtrC family response regulator